MALHRTFANRADDGDDFSRFRCWNGDDQLPWVEEVEDDIRGGWIFKRAPHVLALREDDGELVAVSAFLSRPVYIPIAAPEEVDAWHLHVLAVHIDHQGGGLSAEVIAETLAAMGEVDPARAIFTVRVHEQNAPSIALCNRYRLAPFPQRDPPYLELLGDVGLP